MKYLKSHKEYNEGIRSSLAGAGLAASLMFGTPEVNANNKPETTQSSKQQDAGSVNKMVSELSKIRSEEKVSDEELSIILNEIKNNLTNHDSTKYLEMFNKLSKHIEKKYGYKIESKKIEELNQEEIKMGGSDGMNIFSILGWLGSICLAICGIPQAWMSYKDKHSHGISWSFLLLWAFGELFALTYVYDKLDLPLLLNYAVNILIVSVILYYKIKPLEADTHISNS